MQSQTAAGIWGFPVTPGLVGTRGSFRLKRQQKQHEVFIVVVKTAAQLQLTQLQLLRTNHTERFPLISL